MMALASAFRLRRAGRRPVHAGVGVVALALAVAGLAACRPQEGPGILAWRGQAADPQTIEVANPYRGSYRWQDDAPQPPAWPVRDSYRRVTWRELEPTQGNYDFSRIDEGIATARANGGVFGFRVQAACTGCAAGGVAVPDYLQGSDAERILVPAQQHDQLRARLERSRLPEPSRRAAARVGSTIRKRSSPRLRRHLVIR